MDAQVIINGDDASNYILAITREYNYCTISQNFSLDITTNYSTTINPYAPIVIYEEGVKVLTGYVSSITKSAPEDKISIVGQDTYKRAVDYFIPDTYFTVAGQKVRYWIEFLLGLCGLTATFTDGDGPFVADGEEVGLDSVANVIDYLVQYAGWYGKVDENGDLIFGKMLKNSSVSITESTILNIEYDKNYDKTRNVVHIHGGVDSTLNEFRPIFAKARVDLDYLPKDQIAVVANPYIEDQSVAEDFAQNIINETAKPTFVKNVQVVGNPNLSAGEYIDIYSRLFTGSALITTLNSSFDENGYTMNLILDDLCPRIVAHGIPKGNLYAGTAGSGVWEYNVYTNVWTDISAGLINKNIVDLSVDNGLFIASTPAGIYTKLFSAQWIPQSISLPAGASGVTYPAVYATSYDSQVSALVNYDINSINHSSLYIGTLASGGTSFSWSGIYLYVSGIDNNIDGSYYTGLDMEGDYGTKYIVASMDAVDSTILSSGIHYVSSGIAGQGIYGVDLNGDLLTTIYLNGDISNFASYSNPSPDGTQIVFAAKIDTTGQELYIKDVLGETITKITDASASSGEATYPAWSPDSTQIVYVYKPTPGSTPELYVIDIDGSNNTQITSNGGTAGHPDWSSVSDEIVYDYTSAGATSVYKIMVGGSRTLLRTASKNPSWTSENRVLFTNISTPADPRGWIMNSDGTSASAIYITDTDELHSDDNYESIVYRDTTDNQIYITGTRFTGVPITVDGTISFDPAVIPNDPSKRFISGKNDNTVRTTVFDGSSFSTIYTDSSNPQIEEFNWDTNGEIATAVSHDTGSTPKLLSFSRTAGQVLSTGTLAIDQSTGPFMHPRISRDGGTIAFSRIGQGFEVLRYHVYTMPATGGTPTAYTTEAEFTGPTGLDQGCFMSAWTPHNEIMFHREDDGKYYVDKQPFGDDVAASLGLSPYSIVWHPLEYKYIISEATIGGAGSHFWLVDGDDIYQLSIFSNSSLPTWSHDGEYLVYRAGNDYYTCKADGTNHVFIRNFTNIGDSYQFTYDNKYLLLQDYQTTPLAPRTRIMTNKKRMTTVSGIHPKFGFIPTTTSGTSEIRLLETISDEEFYIVYSGQGFSEVNVDSSLPISVYGVSGLRISEDTFDFPLAVAGTINDVFTRTIDNETHVYATGSTTIYDVIPSGTITTRSITATEIEGRIYGSGEIFFSTAGEVKKSTDNLVSYVDISTGLPGNTITVLRTGE